MSSKMGMIGQVVGRWGSFLNKCVAINYQTGINAILKGPTKLLGVVSTDTEFSPGDVCFAIISIFIVASNIPVFHFFAKTTGPRKYADILEAMVNLEKSLHEIILPKTYSFLRKRIQKSYTAVTSSINLVSFILDHVYPPVLFFVGFSSHNPLSIMVQRLIGSTGILPSYLIRILVGLETFIGLMMMTSTFTICVLLTTYGIVALYLWTLLIIPKNEEVQLDFHVAIKVHNRLGIMTKIHTEMAQNFIVTCLHHFITVLGSTVGMFILLTHLVKSDQVSILIIFIGIGAIVACTVTEFALISYLAKCSRASKEFILRMGRNHGGDKYRRKVIRSLLPNSTNLEVISSLDTLVNGLEMKYFLKFLDRVADSTITLLFG
ncbi:hypothetical protein Fcan01_22780 [Folsomia candida]|uniref:Uncharacterized protein n=1 Tax=Folsomia candida TaxID=158441 RepID=A0A226D9J7_FOLCA|nr:hypothetical protein Fcan01_22780 [Folsomia candida]